ncbi:orotate phosphoribosyltransferase [Bacteriovorax sp. Seq25_V]|uniref:orotate phosphoribosyltransferase n=1 Tax=Bacteriovorax sp. Seq25_V TaxID=1201288 RepID=UPI00038A3AB4|nr:orotate phosphoribosyltransferase [Bacteriovorax sp. Seq25_V]EQC46612.1 orotate phosphoribosyltransferase [Bacteriovorax sp. Seq25_V]
MKDLLVGMLDVGCLKISPKKPFTYTSGLKGPLYCDNRLIPSHPHLRKLVAKGFSDLIDKNHLEYDHISGVATAGITHAAFLAEYRNEPMCYIRSKPKGHGLSKIVEGDVKESANLLLVEDLVNQGASLEAVILQLREHGYKVSSALSIVDYQTPKAQKLLRNLKVDLFSLINFSELAEMALSEKIVDEEGYDLLKSWHADPENWAL